MKTVLSNIPFKAISYGFIHEFLMSKCWLSVWKELHIVTSYSAIDMFL